MPSKKPLTLRDWIIELGSEKVARLLGVNSSTVRHWRRHHCRPKHEQMIRIKKLSHGRVTYTAMIEGFEG